MQFILQHLDSIILAIIAIIVGYDRLRSGTSGLRKEITADYKERNAQLDEQIKALETKHQETLIELAGIKATLAEKDKRIEELVLLNNDRNPDVLRLLKQITDSNTSIMDFMKLMHTTLIDSKSELHYQTGILQKSDDRNTMIDEASKKGQGDPILIPEK